MVTIDEVIKSHESLVELNEAIVADRERRGYSEYGGMQIYIDHAFLERDKSIVKWLKDYKRITADTPEERCKGCTYGDTHARECQFCASYYPDRYVGKE